MDLPETGNINLPTPTGDIGDMNNGERRIITQELGISLQALAEASQAAGGDMAKVAGFDVADLQYAMGRIALRRVDPKYDVTSYADRVVLADEPTEDPTDAS